MELTNNDEDREYIKQQTAAYIKALEAMKSAKKIGRAHV